LLFHTWSRLGRRDLHRYGGTYRHIGKGQPLPALRPDNGDAPLCLPQPDIDRAMRTDPAFISVVEQRRSIREFGEAPITVNALGEFLHRVARVKAVVRVDAASEELLFRVYPAGGAIHELEIYPVIARCEGLSTGIYRYDPARHALARLADRNEQVDTLLSTARSTLNHDCEPQVLLVITARFQRVQWKYESMAYALILKNVGVLYQTMYLTATAMGLAPCALGGGDSDLFAMAAGLNYYAETSVGEFALGTRKEEPAESDAPSETNVEPKC
jgi:SagB-type dehydrogenase family enzyme